MNLSLKNKGRIIFWLGIVLLTIRLVMAFKTGDFSYRESSLAAMGLRGGIMCTVIGLAWNQLIKIPIWLFIGIPIAVLIIIAWPRQALFIVPMIFMLLAIKRWFDKWSIPLQKQGNKQNKKNKSHKKSREK